MTATDAARTHAIYPWTQLAESYSHNEHMREHLMRTGLVVRYITEANIPEDVRAELYTLATEGGSPRMARKACAGWVRSVIAGRSGTGWAGA